ncbi:acyl carrier protein [Fibrisoma montanum]|nr:phosphopantetheine-binding protein [Fibrisoma montanum]
MNAPVRRMLREMGVRQDALSNEADLTLDLGLDSLDRIDLLVQLEIRYGIRIVDQDWHRLHTIRQMEHYVAEQIGRKLCLGQPVGQS